MTTDRKRDREYLRTLKLLYVEDDDDTRSLLARLLGRRLRHVVEARNGREGLDAFLRDRPDIVLTDIQMPGMDGLAMAEEIRRRAPWLPIVVSTAFEEIDYLRRAIDVGVDKYVTKPIDTDALDVVLLETARRLRAERALAREHHRELDALRVHQLEALRLLAGGMAHDFNNLLQGIVGSVGLAEMCAEPGSEIHQLLVGAMDGAREARALGEQLLTLAGDGAGLALGDLGRLLEDSLHSVLAGSDVRLELDVASGLPPVPMEPTLLRRAVSEIAANAREAMSDGGSLFVSARLRRLSDDEVPTLPAGFYVAISFSDGGPGIPADVLPRIFDPYFTLKERSGHRGRGLGLALCLAIARKHHGHITVESPSGGGATFHLFLRATSSAEAPHSAGGSAAW